MKRLKSTDMPSSRTPYGGLAIGGRGGTKRSSRQGLKEESMSVRAVERESQTKKRKQTTSTPSLSQCKVLSGGINMHIACSLMPGASKSFAPCAISSRPMERTQSENNSGLKHDQEKPPLAYIPKAALFAEGEAFKYGAKKYAPFNYRNGIVVTRTLSAAIRHIVQFLHGEDLDSESGVHHLGCARANLAMALDTLESHPEMDDRFKGGKK